MLRVYLGGLLAATAFVCALLLAAEWVTADRPAAWLGRLAGDSGAAGDPQRGQDPRSVPAAPDRREAQVVVAASASSAKPTAPVARAPPPCAAVRRHERHEDPRADEGKESAWMRASDAAAP